MTTAQPVVHVGTPTAQHQKLRSDVRWTGIMIAALSWFLAGLFLDGWAHSHGRVDDSFFTPWHAVFYSGFVVVAGVLSGGIALRRWQGASWPQALPTGYDLALLGVALFAAGGVFDMVWHELVGIEVDVEAALSPSHLLLALGMGLIVSAPFRAAWGQATATTPPRFISLLPMLLSLTYMLSLLAFMTQYAHPFVAPWATTWRDGDSGRIIGIVSILLQTVLLMSCVLLTLRRWRLPFGSFTLILTLNAALMSVIDDHFIMIAVGFVSGVISDVLLHVLRPSVERPRPLRIFAFAMPVVLYSVYFAVLHATYGIVWSTHMWTGAIVLAGAVGWLLSFLLAPPPVPTEIESI